MSNLDTKHKAKFGTLLGTGPGNVAVYSSDYDSADKNELPDRQAYRHQVDGVFTGYKWQCVELARRYLYVNDGYVFDDVAMAYDIFRLRDVRVIADNSRLPLKSFRNGAKRPPEPGCMLIWSEGGVYDMTGHVAIVTEVFPDKVRCIEQNVEDKLWPPGHTYSRERPATTLDDGGYWIDCTYDDAEILGWIIQTDDATNAETIIDADPTLFDIDVRQVEKHGQEKSDWLNPQVPDEAAYIHVMGNRLTLDETKQLTYYRIGETALKELKRATNEMHAFFMLATNYVLSDDDRLRRFNLPPALWSRIHQSWDNRRSQVITGRFDFSLSKRGLKVYEYNCDSASCHLEAGKLQGLWAAHYGCAEGRSPGDELHQNLIRAWRKSEAASRLHIMHDGDDNEEIYHAQYMKTAIEAAGIPTKMVSGLNGLSWGQGGEVLDEDGEPVRWVWKTWAWETALDQIRDQLSDDDENLRLHRTIDRATMSPRLVDVLLRPDVMVFEPLWTLIPSNKAILPILCEMFPNNPYLLNTRYELDDTLIKTGHVVKPIVGRRGENISIYDRNNELVSGTEGQFEERDQIYQALFPLPNIGGDNVQICTFTAGGSYAGACVRTDASMIITADSDILPLRVVPDDQLDAMQD